MNVLSCFEICLALDLQIVQPRRNVNILGSFEGSSTLWMLVFVVSVASGNEMVSGNPHS